ncbi:hypothetical protein BC936DRAFT_138710 [Jimgerdemannia flammicorona]|uniref:Uncharacterized protein n=1 Tax=Jimgerdemannia flammicorona TaxID=994334 RepID=A0A433BR24_9FUNG|nr:hypothetical protein BC936DRAFT_138710 [Jimgerdemannia flammicorona]
MCAGLLHVGHEALQLSDDCIEDAIGELAAVSFIERECLTDRHGFPINITRSDYPLYIDPAVQKFLQCRIGCDIPHIERIAIALAKHAMVPVQQIAQYLLSVKQHTDKSIVLLCTIVALLARYDIGHRHGNRNHELLRSAVYVIEAHLGSSHILVAYSLFNLARSIHKHNFRGNVGSTVRRGQKVMRLVTTPQVAEIMCKQAEEFARTGEGVNGGVMKLLESLLLQNGDAISIATMFFCYPTGQYVNVKNVLHHAMDGNHITCVRYIIETGGLDGRGLKYLADQAIIGGYVDTVALLMKEYHVQFGDNDTLMQAMVFNHIDIAELIWDKDTIYDLDRILIDALSHGGVLGPTVAYLLKRGANANASTDDGEGNSALHLAGTSCAIQVLCEHGADVNRRNLDGKTVLSRIWRIDGAIADQVISTLVEYGADIHEIDNDGNTLLTNLIKSRCDRMVIRSFYKFGADINAIDSDGCTPLHHAISENLFGAILELRILGANLASRDMHGDTPLLAARNCMTEWAIIEFCLLQPRRPKPSIQYKELVESPIFPPEVWSEVFRHFYNNNSLSEFLQASKACRQWRMLAKACIAYHQFLIYNTDYPANMNLLARLLRTTPDSHLVTDTVIITVNNLIDSDGEEIHIVNDDVKDLSSIIRISRPYRLGIFYDRESEWTDRHKRMEDAALKQVLRFATNVEELLTNGYDSRYDYVQRIRETLVKITLSDFANNDTTQFSSALAKCANIRSVTLYGSGSAPQNRTYHKVLSMWPELREVGLFGHGGHLSTCLNQLKVCGKLERIRIASDVHCTRALNELLELCPNLVELQIDTPICEIALVDDDTIRILRNCCPKLQTLTIPPLHVNVSLLPPNVTVVVQ